MATKTVTQDQLESAISNIWSIANDADGSRSGMQDALDSIQDECLEVVPDLDEADADDDSTDDDDNDGD